VAFFGIYKDMETIYYAPKMPQSVPLIDKEKDMVSFMIDGEMIDVPLPLFKKLFEKTEPKSNPLDDEVKKSLLDLKSMGLSREDVKKIISSSVKERGQMDIDNLAERLLDDIF